jgi:uncharacterized membrane protein YraQ (UPF0718 family)
MDLKVEWKPFLVISIIFLACFYLPIGNSRFNNGILESLYLVKWYAREHVILCLLPSFFIAGAIGVFVSKTSVMRYLGADANKFLAYGVASVSGTILAVCSCTILPLFAGIYKMGAGLGPATAFLYSGPAINALAIVLTANVLGWKLGLARAVSAIIFSILIGLIMQFIFRNEESDINLSNFGAIDSEEARPLWKTALFFLFMVGILVFSNWGKPVHKAGLWFLIWNSKWIITTCFWILLSFALYFWMNISKAKAFLPLLSTIILYFLVPNQHTLTFIIGILIFSWVISTGNDETKEWFSQSWDFAKQILPLLFFGVIVAGFLLGRPGGEGVIPSNWINWAVGGNSIRANFFASFSGAFMYFATLTEIPILQGLISNGMGQGPALSLLLAGPALSLPNMLVIRSVMGTKKTIVYISLVIIMATITGVIYGRIV